MRSFENFMFKVNDIVRMKEGIDTTYGVRIKREHLLIVIGLTDDYGERVEDCSEIPSENHRTIYLRTAYLNSHSDINPTYKKCVYDGPVEFREQHHGRHFWNSNPNDLEKL